MAFLRDFRHRVAVLKSQGLIPSDIDARSAYPNWKRNGKKLSTIVEQFDPVASEKATAVKVPASVVRKYRKLGRETAGGRVIEPHGPDETAVYDPKTEAIIIKHKSGIERIQLPIEFHNLEQWAIDVKRNKAKINALKSNSETFGFRYFGNNGSAFFSDIGLFIDFIREYQSYIEAKDTNRKGANVFRNIEILRLNQSAMRKWVTPSERKVQRTREYSRKVMKKFRRKLKNDPGRYAMYLDEQVARMRKHRAKRTKAQHLADNLKAKKSMRKLRRKR